MSKTIVSMVCDDAYESGFIVTVGTLLAHNPWFDHEIRVTSIPDIAPLSPDTRDRMRRRYPNLTFNDVETSTYDDLMRTSGVKPRLRPALAKLEAFSFTDADRVVALDTDLLILGDLTELFGRTEPFIAVEQHRPKTGPQGFANAAVFVANGDSLTGDLYQTLLKTTVSPDNPTPGTADQTVLHEHFGHDPTSRSLPERFNVLRATFPDSQGSLAEHLAAIDARVLHVGGRKPWFAGRSGGRYRQSEHLWREAYLDLATNDDLARMLEIRRSRNEHGDLLA